ncbi:MAG: GNAT family N-acetyltransferase [Planctomycetota bacterium]
MAWADVGAHVVILETDRLLLRPYGPADLEGLVTLLGDPVVMRFWPEPFDRERAVGWYRRAEEQLREHGYSRLATIERATGAYVGDCGLLRVGLDGRDEHDLGWILRADRHGRGYATEAARALLDHALGPLALGRVVANMATDHLASRRVAEKLGMRLEKRFRNPRNRMRETCLYVGEAGEREGRR